MRDHATIVLHKLAHKRTPREFVVDDHGGDGIAWLGPVERPSKEVSDDFHKLADALNTLLMCDDEVKAYGPFKVTRGCRERAHFVSIDVKHGELDSGLYYLLKERFTVLGIEFHTIFGLTTVGVRKVLFFCDKMCDVYHQTVLKPACNPVRNLSYRKPYTTLSSSRRLILSPHTEPNSPQLRNRCNPSTIDRHLCQNRKAPSVR